MHYVNIRSIPFSQPGRSVGKPYSKRCVTGYRLDSEGHHDRGRISRGGTPWRQKRKQATASTKSPLGVAVTLKGSAEWKEWLVELAGHCRLDVAKVIDKALIDYAKSEGFDRDAPRRQ